MEPNTQEANTRDREHRTTKAKAEVGPGPGARRALTVLVLMAALLLSAGCGGLTGGADESTPPAQGGAVTRDLAQEEVMDSAMPPPGEGAAGEDASDTPPEDRLIIRDKSLRLEVESVADAARDIRDLAGSAGGFVTNTRIATDGGPVYRYDEYGTSTGSGGPLSGWITVRVPSDRFEGFVAQLRDLGEVEWEAESRDDVTQEHVDLQARLENLQAEEARLREFFDAAESVEDMLAIERELARVRGEIESLDARISYLERQAAMATVTVELTEPGPIAQPEGPDWGFRQALTTGLRLAADVVNAIIVIGIGALPVLAIVAVLAGVIWLVVRRYRSAHAGSDTE